VLNRSYQVHSTAQTKGYLERVIGSIRRECLDHLIVVGENHLLRILAEYVEYYHHARIHVALGRNAPMPRVVQLPEKGEVVSTPYLGGLHHLYTRAA
jgi:transposase InsO family protein